MVEQKSLDVQDSEFKAGKKPVEPLVLPNGRKTDLEGYPRIIVELLLASKDHSATKDEVLNAVYGPDASEDKRKVLKYSLYKARIGIAADYDIVHCFRASTNGSKDKGELETFFQFIDLSKQEPTFYSNYQIAKAVGRKMSPSFRNLISRRVRSLGMQPDGRIGRANGYLEGKFRQIVKDIKGESRQSKARQVAFHEPLNANTIANSDLVSRPESTFRTQMWGQEVPFLGQRLTYKILSQINRGVWDKDSDGSILKAFRTQDDPDYLKFEERFRRGFAIDPISFSEAKLAEFIAELFFEQLEKSWVLTSNTEKLVGREKDIAETVEILKKQGLEFPDVIEIACKHFGLKVPEKYKKREEPKEIDVFVALEVSA